VSKQILFFAAFLILSSVSIAQTALVQGVVTDEFGNPLELINVTVKGYPIGTSTDSDGFYKLELSVNMPYQLVFSSITHEINDQEIMLKQGQQKQLNIKLASKSEQIQEVSIEDKQVRKSTLSRLDPRLMAELPSATGSFEAMLKTLPGVSSNNELSSQYSVRGGNYDENLVYVNDILIYRPFLIRSGEQEGMSFINSDMVSSVLFSSGGFDARYGDKMSSVLDIKYIKPAEFGGAVSASLMGGSLMLKGRSKDEKFTHISGFRYKTTKYVLNTLETEGDYDPRFLDFQTYMTYAVNKKSEISILGNYASNSYTFIPEDRKTKFGTVNEALELNMFYEGQEVDMFKTATGALAYTHKPSEQLDLKFIGSAFVTNESETFDILTEYWINEVSKDLGSENLGDSIDNMGTGAYLEHARNYLYATILSIEHKGSYYAGFQNWQWGVKAQQENIDDKLSEWVMTDSAGYSLPYNDSEVGLTSSFKAKNSISSLRYSSFLQNTVTYDIQSNELSLTAGIRGSYWDFNEEFIVSPRVNVALKPDWERDFVFKFATGIYYQPAFYKEMRSREGEINNNIKSQKSVHFVLGSDYNFRAWNRPFKLVTEVYYKKLENLIYYTVDNVRILYSGKNDEEGYAFGFDTKINGEFVKGVDSWLSFSVMRTQEDLGRFEQIDSEGNVNVNYPGYMPRPSDQRVNLGMFFQDYFPGNPDYKMHMQLNFGSGLPFNAPNQVVRRDKDRYKSYQRVDLGFSKVIKRSSKEYPKGHYLHHVTDAWISAEIFNLMDRDNTISYEWVADYNGRQYAVENSLTGRRVNIRLMVQF
jgi:hypothetical protein